MTLVDDGDSGRCKDLAKFGKSREDLGMLGGRKGANLEFKMFDLLTGPCSDPDIVRVA